MPKTFYYYVRGTWLDRLLLLFLLLVIAWFSLTVSQEKSLGVSIFYAQKLVAWYPLPQTEVVDVHVQGYLGVSRIQIAASGVRFLSSPCKNQYCVAQHQKHTVGQMVACVPNRVVFMIDGESSLDMILE